MRKINLIAVICMLIMGVKAQNYDITGVKKFSPLSLQAIIEQNEVKGYYGFYKIDKASKKEDIYSLAILDNNLKQTYSVELKKSDRLQLLESAYNGAGFCFSFVDFREKTVEYMMLDKTGKTVGSYTLEASKSEIQMYQASLMSEDDYFAGGVLSVKNKGFVRIGYEKKDGMRVELELIDNTGKVKWTANSGVADGEKSYESANSMYADEKSVVALITTRGKRMSTKGMESNLVFLSSDTGKELFKINQKNDKNQLQYYGVSFDEASSSFFIFGQYFGAEDNILKDDSKGMFIQEIGMDGKMKNETYTPWAGEINSIIVKKMKDEMKGNMKTFIHKVVKTADGKVFAIGEQYRKAASALGIASKVLQGGNSGASVVKIEIHNMFAFEFDNALKIKDVHIIEKEKTNVQLPNGYGTLDANLLGLVMQQWGNFDYCFTSVSSDKKLFNAAYVNFDRDKDAGSKYTIGNISYNKEQKVVVDRIKLTSKPTFFRVMPCKPGYIALFEYFRKEKKAVLRLEKLNN
jgi:hypothetical protein